MRNYYYQIEETSEKVFITRARGENADIDFADVYRARYDLCMWSQVYAEVGAGRAQGHEPPRQL